MSNNLKFFHFKSPLVDSKKFEAGHLELSKYISNLMQQNENRNMSRHYIGMDENNVISMLCLSASTLKLVDLVEPHDSYPNDYELPTIKIGRLVVDKRFRGKRFGEQTLQKAISIFVKISQEVGVIGLTVDAKKDSVKFYEKYGFSTLNSNESEEHTPMILYTKTLKENYPVLFEDPV